MIVTRTRVVLLVHPHEVGKLHNTGLPAVRSLTHGTVEIVDEQTVHVPEIHHDELPVFLYPEPDAPAPLHYLASGRPIVLVVLDGNWPQVHAMRQRLGPIACMTLPGYQPASATARGLATATAIGKALRILEGASGLRVEAEILDAAREALDRRGPP